MGKKNTKNHQGNRKEINKCVSVGAKHIQLCPNKSQETQRAIRWTQMTD